MPALAAGKWREHTHTVEVPDRAKPPSSGTQHYAVAKWLARILLRARKVLPPLAQNLSVTRGIIGQPNLYAKTLFASAKQTLLTCLLSLLSRDFFLLWEFSLRACTFSLSSEHGPRLGKQVDRRAAGSSRPGCTQASCPTFSPANGKRAPAATAQAVPTASSAATGNGTPSPAS